MICYFPFYIYIRSVIQARQGTIANHFIIHIQAVILRLLFVSLLLPGIAITVAVFTVLLYEIVQEGEHQSSNQKQRFNQLTRKKNQCEQ